jgi:hypothetical protein
MEKHPMDPQQQPTQPPQPPQQPPVDYPQQHMPVAPQPPTPPETAVVTPTEILTPGISRKPSIKLPLILMIWPTAALIVSILLYVLISILLGSSDSGVLSDASPLKAIFNIVLFIVGGLSVFLGPISFIVGLVLLIVRKTSK